MVKQTYEQERERDAKTNAEAPDNQARAETAEEPQEQAGQSDSRETGAQEPLFAYTPPPDWKPRRRPPFVVRLLTTLAMGIFVVGVLLLAFYGAIYLFVQPVTVQQDDSSGTSQSVSTPILSPTPPVLQEPVVIGPDLDLQMEKRPDEETLSINSKEGPFTIPEIARAVRPSVVGIVRYQEGLNVPAGQGSGIIVREDGYIVTNAHVVADGDALSVVLYNGEEYKGTVVGVDNCTDLAVVKISANNLYPATFGDSSQIEVGEDVVAIGNPGGLDYAGSVSRGIVSGDNRSVRTSYSAGYSVKCLQTDAAINPGNSGGPLVDMYGRVIGINSSKIVLEGYEGIGFAIPIDTVLPIVEDIVKYGRVTGRVWLGIGAQPITEVQAGLQQLPQGLMITSIYEDSNLPSAGVRPNDILLQIDERDIRTLDQLREVLDGHKPGDAVVLTIYRSTGKGTGIKLEIPIYLLEDTGSVVGTTIAP